MIKIFIQSFVFKYLKKLLAFKKFIKYIIYNLKIFFLIKKF